MENTNQEMKKFYCYSYQLAKFVQSEGHSFINRYQNKEGKWVWIFNRTTEFEATLTLWDEFKTWKKINALKRERDYQAQH